MFQFQEWLKDPKSISLNELNRLERQAYEQDLDSWPAIAYTRSATEHYLRGDKSAYQFEKEIAINKVQELATVFIQKELSDGRLL